MLRCLDRNDLNDFHQVRNHPEVLRYLGRAPQPLEKTQEVLQKVLEEISNNRSIIWGICLKGHSNVIGNVSYWKMQPDHHFGEIGYVLLPDHWRSGIMSEAIVAVLKYGFMVMNLHRVEANIDPENTASYRLLEKIGFRREAIFKENFYFDGRFSDSYIYGLLKSEFMDSFGETNT
jgi:ribosomal-protein-alanine N-acetyltransferase